MTGTPEWLQEKIRTYYQATNETSYLPYWSGEALSYHYGLADESTLSLDAAHIASNAYVAERLDVRAGLDVLDAGCGVGGTSIWMAKNLGARMTGLTLDPSQVVLAQRFARERGVSETTSFHAMDYAATTFAPESFDVAFNLESVCHCIDTRAYFAHVMTLLRDGGLYGCMECFRARDSDPLIDEVSATWALPKLQTMSEIVTALEASGFEDVTAVDLSPRVLRTAQQMKAMANNRLLVMKLEAAVGGAKDSAAYEGHVRGAVACSDALLTGVITYGFVRARRPGR